MQYAARRSTGLHRHIFLMGCDDHVSAHSGSLTRDVTNEESTMKKPLHSLLLVLVLVLPAACSKENATDTTAAAPKKAVSSASSVANPYVHAVKVTVGEAPMELAFELQSKPVINQPIAVAIRMTGMFNSTGITARFSAREPLKVQETADWKLDSLQAGQAQDYPVTVMAGTAGIYTLDVAVEATRDNYTKTFNYAIPIAITDVVTAAPTATAEKK